MPDRKLQRYNVALPAAVDPVSIPAKAGSSDDPVIEDEIAEEVPAEGNSIVIGSAEEARTVERHVIHMPKNPHCEVCLTANIQRKSK